MAIYLSSYCIPEYARFYIEQLNRSYNQADLAQIAEGQLAIYHAVQANTSNRLICDTDLLTIKIWAEYAYGHCPNWIIKQIEESDAIYFLCNIDIPWTADPQREHPNNRVELYQLYKDDLIAMGKVFYEISGQGEERWKNVKKYYLNVSQNENLNQIGNTAKL